MNENKRRTNDLMYDLEDELALEGITFYYNRRYMSDFENTFSALAQYDQEEIMFTVEENIFDNLGFDETVYKVCAYIKGKGKEPSKNEHIYSETFEKKYFCQFDHLDFHLYPLLSHGILKELQVEDVFLHVQENRDAEIFINTWDNEHDAEVFSLTGRDLDNNNIKFFYLYTKIFNNYNVMKVAGQIYLYIKTKEYEDWLHEYIEPKED